MSAIELDQFDKAILRILQRDASPALVATTQSGWTAFTKPSVQCPKWSGRIA